MKMQRVVIVAEGGLVGMQAEAGYTTWQRTMVAAIEAARQRDPTTKQDVPRAVVTVVPSIDNVRASLSSELEGRPQVVVFRTANMIETARELKREYPGLKVVVFAGRAPEDEVVIVHKGWHLGREGILSVILD